MNAVVSDRHGSTGPRYHRVVVTRHGGPDVLRLVEGDRPEPRPGEVRVKVMAAGVSAYDLMFRRSGALPGTPGVPFTPGADVAGVVDKPGEGAAGVEPGQMVAGATFCLGGMGGYAEFICLPARELVAVPSGVDPAEAVCVVVNYLTAHMVLHRAAGIRSGERILVHGAAGGVGTALPPDLGKDNAWYRQTLAELLDLLAKGKIKPVIAARIPLAEAARAHELLEHGRYAGKVVLVAGASSRGGMAAEGSRRE